VLPDKFGTVYLIVRRLNSSTLLPIHYSVIPLPSGRIQTQQTLLTAPLHTVYHTYMNCNNYAATATMMTFTKIIIDILTGRSGFRMLAEARDFTLVQNVHNGSEAPQASYSIGVGVPSHGKRRPGCDVHHSLPSSAKVKNMWRCAATPPRALMATFALYYNNSVQFNSILFNSVGVHYPPAR
jgi:hypothetical protein